MEAMTLKPHLPGCMICPLLGDVMDDPIYIVESAQTVSRKGFLLWLREGNKTCPVTGLRLRKMDYRTNFAMKSCVEWWQKGHQGCFELESDGRSCSDALTPSEVPTATDLLSSAIHGEVQLVKKLIKHDNLQLRGSFGETPLHNASLWGHHEVVEELLNAGFNADEQDNEGRTCLWLASFMGWIDVCKILLLVGADPTIRSNLGNTPLWCAISRHHSEIEQLLRASGATD